MRHLPEAMRAILEKRKMRSKSGASVFAQKNNALFLGRGMHYPIALEGALKLKEISYLHAEGYPAGELKHGPLALVDAEMPVVTVAPNDELLEKLKGNMEEVRARKGELFVFSDQGCNIQPSEGMHVIQLPEITASFLRSFMSFLFSCWLSHGHCKRNRCGQTEKPR